VTWKKASASNPNENCVECATLAGTVLVRDSKEPHGAALAYSPEAFNSFVAAVSRSSLTPIS
jgi:hypothetical protein